jgi:hypothetical protein
MGILFRSGTGNCAVATDKRVGVASANSVFDENQLSAWLSDKPPAFARAISLRAILRTLPLSFGPMVRKPSDDSGINLALQIFRATFIVWAARARLNYPKEVHAAASALGRAAEAADADADAAYAAYAAVAAAVAAYAAADSAAYAYATAAAAAAADVDATDAANQILWESIAADVDWINNRRESVESVALAHRFMVERLWIRDVRGGERYRVNIPLWARAPWDAFKKLSTAKDAGFDVWFRWYESVLAGHKNSYFDGFLNGTAEQDFIGRLASQPTVFWERKANIVNAEIKSWIKGATKKSTEAAIPPTIPEVRPAAIEPHWQEGKLTLPNIPLPSDLDAPSLMAALTALHDDLIELADDATDTENIDHRPAKYLRRLADRIPDVVPTQAVLFRLAHAREALDDFASATDREWPDLLAARYRKMILQYDRTVRQFPKWRAFVRNAAEQKLTTEQIAEVPQIAETVVAELQTDDAREFVDPQIPDTLQMAQAPIVDWEEVLSAGNEQLAEDVLESINNVLKRTVELSLALKSAGIDPVVSWTGTTTKKSFEEFGKEAKKSIVKEFGNLGQATGPALGRFLKRIAKVTTYGGTAAGGGVLLLQRLFTLFPDTFGWLEPALRFLHLL